MPSHPPIALSIAGSDCSAGAGIQADLKTFSAHGVFGLTAITCVVAEVPGKVQSITEVPPAALAEQLKLLREAFPIAAIKTGMLYSGDHVRVVLDWLHTFNESPPLVVDPVMVATSGDSLMRDAAMDVYTCELLPLASVITPNIDEALALGCAAIGDEHELRSAAGFLAKKFDTHVLAKGGHLSGDDAVDVLAYRNGDFQTYTAPFVRGVNTHGTGCTYSAAIAAELATGLTLPDATGAAKRFVSAAIHDYFQWGMTDALNHFPKP